MATTPLSYDTTADISLAQLGRTATQWLRRNLIWMGLGMLVGAGVGYMLYRTTPPVYSSRMVGYGNNLDDLRVREILADLNIMRATGEVDRLAKALSITQTQARDLNSITGLTNDALELGLPAYPPRDMEGKKYYFVIEATTVSPQDYPQLQQRIIAYVDNQPYVAIQLAQQRRTIQAQITSYDQELAYLTEVKQAQFRPGSTITDPGAVSVHSVNIVEKRALALERLQKLEHELAVTKDFEISIKPITPGPYRSLINGAIGGLVFSLIGLGIIALARFARG